MMDSLHVGTLVAHSLLSHLEAARSKLRRPHFLSAVTLPFTRSFFGYRLVPHNLGNKKLSQTKNIMLSYRQYFKVILQHKPKLFMQRGPSFPHLHKVPRVHLFQRDFQVKDYVISSGDVPVLLLPISSKHEAKITKEALREQGMRTNGEHFKFQTPEFNMWLFFLKENDHWARKHFTFTYSGLVTLLEILKMDPTFISPDITARDTWLNVIANNYKSKGLICVHLKKRNTLRCNVLSAGIKDEEI